MDFWLRNKNYFIISIQRNTVCPSVCVCTYVSVPCLVAQLHPTLCNPVDYSPPDASVHGDSPGKNTGDVCMCFPGGSDGKASACNA